MPPARKEKNYDDSKLQQMQDPMSVHIERIVNGKKEPLTNLPMRDGQVIPGQGWTADDVRFINQFLKDDPGCGPGLYTIRVTDAQGMLMEWEAYFARPPVAAVPGAQGQAHVNGGVQVPAPAAGPPPDWMLANARAHAAAQGQVIYAAPGYAPPPAAPPQPIGFNAWGQPIMGAPAAPPAPSPWGAAPSPWGAPPAPPAWGPSPWGAPPPAAPAVAAPSAITAELERLREDKRQLEEERRIDAIRRENKDAQDALAKQIETLAKAVAEIGKKPDSNPEMERMRDDNRRRDEEQRRRDDDQRRREDREASDRMFREMKESTDKQIAAITARPTGPDPMLQMVMESNRLQIESQKEIARIQAESQKDMMRNQTTTKDVIELSERMRVNSGMDQIVPQLTSVYTGVVGLMKQVTEMGLGMQGQGAPNPVIEAVSKVGLELSQMAQNYMNMNRDVKVGEQQVERAKANAAAKQAEAQMAQQQLGTPPVIQQHRPNLQVLPGGAAATPAPAAPPPPPVPPPTVLVSNFKTQVEGVSCPCGVDYAATMEKCPSCGRARADAKSMSAEAVAAAAPASAPAPTAAQAAAAQGREAEVRAADLQLFGPAVESVYRLRQSVAEGKVNPQQATAGLFMAIQKFNEAGHPLPEAFTLFQHGMFGDLVTYLVPHAPTAFKNQFIAELSAAYEKIKAAQNGAATPEGAGDDDDDDEGDEGETETEHDYERSDK